MDDLGSFGLEEWILRGFGSHGLVVDLLDSEFCWLWQ
jgi:hypothetical protein